MLIRGLLAERILSRYRFSGHDGNYYEGKSKLEACLGKEVWSKLAGKRVLDFGCGEGTEVIEIASKGVAESVCGVDIVQRSLDRAEQRAKGAGLFEPGMFRREPPSGAFDVVISLDAFEHYPDPLSILKTMYDLVVPGGSVLVSFGPPWYHPWGSHLVIFPWAHLVFTERSLMEWRAKFKTDGAKRFNEVEGGLNQMTIGRFVKLVRASGWHLGKLELIPIRGVGFLHNRLWREFMTSSVRAELVKG